MILKTLKDFDPEACCHGIRAHELRKVAVEWIRHWCRQPCGQSMKITTDRSLRRKAFMEFFNLTEENIITGDVYLE